MRLRLFTLLLVPTLALLVLGALIISDRQRAVDDAAAASELAELAVQLADFDKALGAEALASTRYIDGEISWIELTAGSFVATDLKLSAIERDNPTLSSGANLNFALSVIKETLSNRTGIRDRAITPLQVVTRYSRIRRVMLDAASVEISAGSSSESSNNLFVLAALVEARSAHLNERIALDLAIESGEWPTGQHAAAILAIATHDSHLRFANNLRPPGLDEIAISNSLAVVRSNVRLSLAAPNVSTERWEEISDGWSSTLERQIDQDVVQVTAALRRTQQSAAQLRRAAAVLIGLTLLAAFMVAILVSMRIVRRVQVITSKAALLAAGDTSESSLASSLVGGHDEIAELAEAFDNMSLEISIREDASEIESSVLEAIASGEEIELTLRTLEWLLGSKAGRRDYRFITFPPSSQAEPIGEVTEGYTPLYIEPVGDAEPMVEPYQSQARSAVNLAILAQRRADDIAMLHRRATRDPLTGLLNRRAILEDGAAWLAQAGESDEPFPALIFADLDGFKKINDNYGHAAGDLVLVETAERMRTLISNIGGNVGRVGGDEFVIIVASVEDARRLDEISQMVVDSVSEPIDVGGDRVQVGVSIGAVLARPDAPMADLVSDADDALYAAKAAGRGQTVISDSEFRDQTSETAELTSRVVEALHNEDFIPWFQPVWSENGTRIAAFEALVRWKAPEGRTLAPGRFLPILEQQNLIGALDALMFRKVCLILSEWEAGGRPLVPIHLNVSPRRIENLDFVSETKATLEETGVAPELIIVEVTESDLMTDISQNGRRLQELRDIGVLIAADDFGTGYSSLSYLRDLPVDILKIDRQFISEIDKSPTNIKIVSAIIKLAQSLGLSVVAEGVEREEELAVLNEHGCHYIQGFLLGKPIPRKETEALIGRNSGNLSTELAERLPAVPPDVDQTVLDKHFDSLRDHLAEFGDRLSEA